MHPPVTNLVGRICAKNHESWLAVGKVFTIIIRLTFLAYLYMEKCNKTRVL